MAELGDLRTTTTMSLYYPHFCAGTTSYHRTGSGRVMTDTIGADAVCHDLHQLYRRTTIAWRITVAPYAL